MAKGIENNDGSNAPYQQDGQLLICRFCVRAGISCTSVVGSQNRFAVREKQDSRGNSVVYSIGVNIPECRDGRTEPIKLSELENKNKLISEAVVTPDDMDTLRRVQEQTKSFRSNQGR